MSRILMLVVMLFFLGTEARAKDAADSSAIRETARNYMESWYRGDSEQMKRCLHKKLAKRSVKQGYGDSTTIGSTSRAEMVGYTKGGYGANLREENLQIDISILDQGDNVASVKVVTPHYYEYLHLAKTSDGWVIVNALYE